MGDVEIEASLVDQQVHLAIWPGPHRIDTEMHDALPRQPFDGGDIHVAIFGRADHPQILPDDTR